MRPFGFSEHVKQLRSYLIALAVGAAPVWVIPVVLALVAALPGLGAVLRFIKGHGLPPVLFTVLVSFAPLPLVAFAAGTLMVRTVSGAGVKHLLLCAVPWLLHAAYVWVLFYLDPEFDLGVNWAWEIPALSLVPAGLLLALAVIPARPDTPRLHVGVRG